MPLLFTESLLQTPSSILDPSHHLHAVSSSLRLCLQLSRTAEGRTHFISLQCVGIICKRLIFKGLATRGSFQPLAADNNGAEEQTLRLTRVLTFSLSAPSLLFALWLPCSWQRQRRPDFFLYLFRLNGAFWLLFFFLLRVELV